MSAEVRIEFPPEDFHAVHAPFHPIARQDVCPSGSGGLEGAGGVSFSVEPMRRQFSPEFAPSKRRPNA
jgi:hypothetical protein